MTVVALELNDAGISAVRDGASDVLAIPESPGYAVVEDGTLVTGVDARARARLKPRFTHTQFWDALDTTPLSRPFPSKLSRADLAHTHLKQVWESLQADDGVDEAVLAVPGWYSLEQLGLILGMARACDISINGMIDSALAAAAGVSGPSAASPVHAVHLDIHLHRVSAARIVREDRLVRENTVVNDDVGLIPLYDAWATFLAQSFVRQTRYDPLHSAESEQELYDLLPAWLETFIDDDEATLSLRPTGKKLAIELDRRQLVGSAAAYYEPIAALATSVMPPDEPVILLVSHRLGKLPGLVEKLSRDVADNLILLPPEAAAAGALTYDKHVPSPRDEGSLTFLTTLHLGDGGKPFETDPSFHLTRNSGDNGRSPTHLLLNGVAHALAPEPFLLGVSIPEGKHGLNLVGDTAGISRYHCSIYTMDGRIVVEDHSKFGSFVNGKRVHERASLAAGDRLRLGTPGVEVQLIEVER